MGLFDRFRQGLTKTRSKISRSFQSVLPFGRKIDDTLINELEETMLADDMGPVATAMDILPFATAKDDAVASLPPHLVS